jgi:hypothetical protein
MTALGVAGLFAVMILGLYWLQYHEFFEVGSSITSGLRNTRSIIRDKINARDVTKTISCAKDFAELQAVVAESAGTFRFTAMSLSDMRSRFVPAAVSPPQLSNDPAWRFEYPILAQNASMMNVYLTIWCSVAEKRKPAVAERIALIIAPTIATWLQARDSVILEAAMQASAPIHVEPVGPASGRTRRVQRETLDSTV